MRLVIVPSALALLPEYASTVDPVAEVRAATEAAVAWLVADAPAACRGTTPSAKRIGAELLGESHGSGPGLLVVANGSATRSEKAPGHLDERAAGFDAAIGKALADGDLRALADLDLDLAAELWAPDAAAFRGLSGFTPASTQVDYDDAPYGVQYWVVRYECPEQ
ncbi:MAG: hypothetical protein JWQ74_2717 [Marmoricola sp.]|nr:hypothetical protein [Marmoricola sp.]